MVPFDSGERPNGDSGRPREIAASAEDPERYSSRSEERHILAQALAELDPLLRRVCVLRDLEDFSTEETACQLGLSKGAVRTRLFRGRLKLRERLRSFFVHGQIDRGADDGGARKRRAPGPALPSMACGD